MFEPGTIVKTGTTTDLFPIYSSNQGMSGHVTVGPGERLMIIRKIELEKSSYKYEVMLDGNLYFTYTSTHDWYFDELFERV